jgi:hypothetical protein
MIHSSSHRSWNNAAAFGLHVSPPAICPSPRASAAAAQMTAVTTVSARGLYSVASPLPSGHLSSHVTLAHTSANFCTPHVADAVLPLLGQNWPFRLRRAKKPQYLQGSGTRSSVQYFLGLQRRSFHRACLSLCRCRPGVVCSIAADTTLPARLSTLSHLGQGTSQPTAQTANCAVVFGDIRHCAWGDMH